VSELSAFFFTLMISMWLCFPHLSLYLWSLSVCMSTFVFRLCQYSHIVTVLSAFVLTLMILKCLYSLQLFVCLWSHCICVVYIRFYACNRIEAVSVYICFYACNLIVTVLSTFLFMHMIKLRLHIQNMCSRLWSYFDCIVSIFTPMNTYYLFSLYFWPIFYSIGNICVHSYVHIVTVLPTHVFSIMKT
jgi:hypothetical protein